ncbi:MAG TPA: hypothetical protein VHJ17_21610, partial [Thermomonospora sp.]|nr:hypothetical protein [Thermomonospora sp.]
MTGWPALRGLAGTWAARRLGVSGTPLVLARHREAVLPRVLVGGGTLGPVGRLVPARAVDGGTLRPGVLGAGPGLRAALRVGLLGRGTLLVRVRPGGRR